MENEFDYFSIPASDKTPRKGSILISEPFLEDSYFKRSIVLLTEHNDQGSVGFILNKRVEIEIGDILKDFPEFKTNISLGGPVSTSSVHYIHTLGEALPESVKVFKSIYWGGNFEKLKELISLGLVKPHQIRFFVGYSGWSSGQLEHELKEGSWVVADMEPELIMTTEEASCWNDAFTRLGDRYKIWSNIPDNPSYN
jgi:putative transcriptional regulator